MEQKSKIDIHFFEFKHFNKSSPRKFKLRFSILSSPIPEQKMIKGSQPLAEYHPQEFRFTKSFYADKSTSPNEILSFDITKNFNPIKDLTNKKITDSQKSLDIVIELFFETTPSSLYAKSFQLDKQGYINIGHNIIRIKNLDSVHEPVQLVFDEVLFCSVGLVLHVQTVKMRIKEKLKSGKNISV
jgi:hypothetical protein